MVSRGDLGFDLKKLVCSNYNRALDKREYLMIIFFSSKPYVVTPHLKCLVEMV